MKRFEVCYFFSFFKKSYNKNTGTSSETLYRLYFFIWLFEKTIIAISYTLFTLKISSFIKKIDGIC